MCQSVCRRSLNQPWEKYLSNSHITSHVIEIPQWHWQQYKILKYLVNAWYYNILCFCSLIIYYIIFFSYCQNQVSFIPQFAIMWYIYKSLNLTLIQVRVKVSENFTCGQDLWCTDSKSSSICTVKYSVSLQLNLKCLE